MPLCVNRIGLRRQPLPPTRSRGRVSRSGRQALGTTRRRARQRPGERPSGCRVPQAHGRDGRAGSRRILARSCFRRRSMPAGKPTGSAFVKAAACRYCLRLPRLRLKLARAAALSKVGRSAGIAKIDMQPAYRAHLSIFPPVCRLPNRQGASLPTESDLASQSRSSGPCSGQFRDFILREQQLRFGWSSLRIEYR